MYLKYERIWLHLAHQISCRCCLTGVSFFLHKDYDPKHRSKLCSQFLSFNRVWTKSLYWAVWGNRLYPDPCCYFFISITLTAGVKQTTTPVTCVDYSLNSPAIKRVSNIKLKPTLNPASALADMSAVYNAKRLQGFGARGNLLAAKAITRRFLVRPSFQSISFDCQ